MTDVLTYRYKLLPTRDQHRALERILDDQRQLYNAALEERIECYRKTGKGRTFYEQCKGLTECREYIPEMSAIAVNLQRATLKRLDDAYAKFFLRVKGGDKVGRPRFKGAQRFNSFGFCEFRGISLDGNRLRFKGFRAPLRVNVHRPIPVGKILSCQFCRSNKGWTISLQIRSATPSLREGVRAVGADVGINTLVALSDGNSVENLRIGARAAKRLRVAQRALVRCKKGSKRRRKVREQLSRVHTKIRNTRRTYLHQVTARLVKEYDLIAVEALNIAGLSSSVLSGPIRDAAWGTLVNFLRYKAARAGAQLIEVDPRYTSQTCPDCGAVAKKRLKQRWHSCPCGSELDRDVAAARVILNRAVAGPGAHNVIGYGVRGLGNLGERQDATVQVALN